MYSAIREFKGKEKRKTIISDAGERNPMSAKWLAIYYGWVSRSWRDRASASDSYRWLAQEAIWLSRPTNTIPAMIDDWSNQHFALAWLNAQLSALADESRKPNALLNRPRLNNASKWEIAKRCSKDPHKNNKTKFGHTDLLTTEDKNTFWTTKHCMKTNS